MTRHDQFFSRAAEQMKESAIRRMGSVMAGSRDIVSFAPGYPAPETFPWTDFRDIAADLLGGKDPGVLQYGPTRGYRPSDRSGRAPRAIAATRPAARAAAGGSRRPSG